MKLIIKDTLGNYYSRNSRRSFFTLGSNIYSYKKNIIFCLEWLREERKNMAKGWYEKFQG